MKMQTPICLPQECEADFCHISMTSGTERTVIWCPTSLHVLTSPTFHQSDDKPASHWPRQDCIGDTGSCSPSLAQARNYARRGGTEASTSILPILFRCRCTSSWSSQLMRARKEIQIITTPYRSADLSRGTRYVLVSPVEYISSASFTWPSLSRSLSAEIQVPYTVCTV